MNNTLNWKRNILPAAQVLGVAAVVLQLMGCGPELNFAYMAKDSAGKQKTTKFQSVGNEMHCVMEMVGGDEDTVITLNLSGPDGISLSENETYPRPGNEQGPVPVDIQLLQYDQATGDVLDDGPWPIGSYSIEILIEDDLEDTLDFQVVP
jgi:hypothetical protein